ncbi:hypothetical protein [Haloferula sargassicola]|uniref:HEAT repeat domain-containing protein n=1 Tax=Haloferula sargassicola TaxID=490096 RepID=A0ABP9UNK2_9BACT
MDEAEQESETITIRCPKCTQRFKVPPDYMGKMVECGGCDERFRVTEEVAVRARRFYPGEHRDPRLEHFSRVPMKSGPMPKFQPAPNLSGGQAGRQVETFSPVRLMLGIAAVAFIVLVGFILVSGGAPGRVLDGASMTERLVLAGFTGILATVLLVLANPWARKKGLLGGLAGLAVLLALPFLIKDGLPDPGRSQVEAAGSAPGPAPASDPLADPYAAMKEEMTYSKLAEAISAYGPDGVEDGATAMGVWLRDVREYNKDLIVKFLIRGTHADAKSWAYSRPPSDYLVVLHGVSPDIKPLRKLCERFGKVGRVVEELQVVEVTVDNQRFVAGPLAKLADPDDPAFYELNRRELESIDPQRVARAVKRLANSPAKLYRPDIAARFRELLAIDDDDMRSDLARGLMVWADPGDGSAEAVHDAARRIAAAGDEVPRPMIEFLVQQHDERAIPFIHELWLKQPRDWEALYGDLGRPIEETVMTALDEDSMLLRMSAIRLLGRVGGARSLAALQQLRSGSAGEIRAQIEQAIASIQNRR